MTDSTPARRWTPAFVGIGSNLNDPRRQVEEGISALATVKHTKLVARSKLYRSAPLGPKEQPDFVNAAAELLTQLNAVELLSELKSLEKNLGRAPPAVRWGPRIIDFDLLVFGAEHIDSESLKVPHPGVAERAFVIVPLMEIAPHLDVPGVGHIETIASHIDLSSVTLL